MVVALSIVSTTTSEFKVRFWCKEKGLWLELIAHLHLLSIEHTVDCSSLVIAIDCICRGCLFFFTQIAYSVVFLILLLLLSGGNVNDSDKFFCKTLEHSFFLDKKLCFLDQKLFWANNFFRQEIFVGQTNVWPTFFRPTFFRPSFFRPKLFLDL